MSQPPELASYLFDRTQADQERLIRSSEALSEFTIEACLRAGLRAGARAIDVGCGPCGALPVLAALVGSDGHVLGLDSSGEALTVARAALGQRGCTNVTLVPGELETVEHGGRARRARSTWHTFAGSWSINATPPPVSPAWRASCGVAVGSSRTIPPGRDTLP